MWILAILTIGCSLVQQSHAAKDCVNTNIVSAPNFQSFYPNEFQITSAIDFNIKYYNEYKVLTNIKANETYVLYPCGHSQPHLKSPGVTENAKFFATPLQAVSVPDATAAAFMAELNVLDRVVHSNEYAPIECIVALNDICNNRVNEEIDATFNFYADHDNPKAIAFTATADPGPLNRAEWIKFMSVFFNKEDTANEIFKNVQDNYNQLKFNGLNQRPVVAWLQWTPAQWTPFGYDAVKIQTAQYKNHITYDAGGTIYDQHEWINVSQVDNIIQDIDVIIDEAFYSAENINDFIQLYNVSTQRIKAISVYRTDKTIREGGFSSWFGKAVVRPDIVIAELLNRKQRFVFRNIGTNESSIMVTGTQCRMNKCTIPYRPICPHIYLNCRGFVVPASKNNPCPSQPPCTVNGAVMPPLPDTPPLASTVTVPSAGHFWICFIVMIYLNVVPTFYRHSVAGY